MAQVQRLPDIVGHYRRETGPVTNPRDKCTLCGKPVVWMLGGEFWLHDKKAGDPESDHVAPNPRPEPTETVGG